MLISAKVRAESIGQLMLELLEVLSLLGFSIAQTSVAGVSLASLFVDCFLLGTYSSATCLGLGVESHSLLSQERQMYTSRFLTCSSDRPTQAA
jgi:hypothetical protein